MRAAKERGDYKLRVMPREGLCLIWSHLRLYGPTDRPPDLGFLTYACDTEYYKKVMGRVNFEVEAYDSVSHEKASSYKLQFGPDTDLSCLACEA
ncbi:MAG: hypothetical protein A2162_01575 [Deltaproteobacteria bacterium RBG_13_52_11b]|nr:MAG: hypothetical protein A2162_01575 [Deltaproteobacteria bacterium RBG_13_52_11b]